MLQYFFFRQWKSLKQYVNDKGIDFIGDLPIYVSQDSVDVWAHPELFQLDENLMPKEVSGCPPDGFSATGQLWGNPLFDWDKMAEDDYAWWVGRIDYFCHIYDVLRIDLSEALILILRFRMALRQPKTVTGSRGRA